MGEKSHVSLDTKVCPICGKEHTVGVLLDKRLRQSLERKTITGWEPCPECQGRIDDGYVAMVGAKPPEGAETLKLEEAYRTGEIMFVRRAAFSELFNFKLQDDQHMMFVDPEVIKQLQGMAEGE